MVTFIPSESLKEFWHYWHNYKVKFEIVNLFSAPIFAEDSAVWISNVFHYEPNIFKYGWEECKRAKQQLINDNKKCIIFTT